MSKQMTPCEKLGYKVGDEFEVVKKSYKFDAGDVVCLQNDDGTASPYFTNEIVKDEHPAGVACFLSSIKKVAKLKPAKQALADAIHQNGGWPNDARWTLATSNGLGHVFCWTDKPHLDTWNWTGGTRCISIATLGRIIPNWHQCIISRDEYFAAYPEQVKVEVNNETENKVDVEMKSESEVTIKFGDWHKNGELPPVGEVCEAHITSENIWVEIEVVAHKDGFALGWCRNEKCGYHGNENSDFRPLRTERDNAIDEMINVGGLRARDGAREVFGRLYDAGMYKEVK